MVKLDIGQAQRIKHWFLSGGISGFPYLSLVQSYFDCSVGTAWTDSATAPSCARITVGDFSFLAGDARRGMLLLPKGESWAFMIFVASGDEWEGLLNAAYPGRVKKVSRYALEQPRAFATGRLRGFAAGLPDGFALARINAGLYRQILASPLSDLCGQFASEREFLERGLGYVALKEGLVVGGSSSYGAYSGGIEIEVDTLKAYRRLGLARACSARLILECLAQGITPCWDAANLESLALAKQLGYVFSCEYPAFFVGALGQGPQ